VNISDVRAIKSITSKSEVTVWGHGLRSRSGVTVSESAAELSNALHRSCKYWSALHVVIYSMEIKLVNYRLNSKEQPSLEIFDHTV